MAQENLAPGRTDSLAASGPEPLSSFLGGLSHVLQWSHGLRPNSCTDCMLHMAASARDKAHGKRRMGRVHPSLQCGTPVDPELARGKGRSLSPACLLRTEAVIMSRFPALDYD